MMASGDIEKETGSRISMASQAFTIHCTQKSMHEDQETSIIWTVRHRSRQCLRQPSMQLTSTINVSTQTVVMNTLQMTVRRWSTEHPVPKQLYCTTQMKEPSSFLNNGRFPNADILYLASWTSREVTSLSRVATADANQSCDFTVE